MNRDRLSVRKQELEDNELIVDYFLSADKNFLLDMGVDGSKLPPKENWLDILDSNYNLENDKKNFYYIIWLMNNKPVGHCNINKIKVKEEAYLHLHLWQTQTRQKGLGVEFLKLSVPIFFQVFELKRLYCEPYSLNPAPNKTLQKFGFDLMMTYETTPGWINFHQQVNKWCLTQEKLESMPQHICPIRDTAEIMQKIGTLV